MAALTSRRVTAGGRSSFTPDGVRVHRRLDRTPELADKFRKLTPENKAKLYSLRSAVEETKLKMSRLEDDLEEKYNNNSTLTKTKILILRTKYLTYRTLLQ